MMQGRYKVEMGRMQKVRMKGGTLQERCGEDTVHTNRYRNDADQMRIRYREVAGMMHRGYKEDAGKMRGG